MKPAQKTILLLICTIIAIIAVFSLHPIAQPLSFHNFADHRSWLGIPNFGNVASNLPFLVIGIIGLRLTWRAHVTSSIRLIYSILFIGVLLTGLGSGYYHSNPNNNTLVWDRIPMTIIFMALFSATVAELINMPWGLRLLFPLVFLGIASVYWWHYTEDKGHGDLRLYMLIQYYPMLFIPLILWLFYEPIHKPTLKCLLWVVIWYVIAKIFEQLDYPIFRTLGISGHTLKHLAAAVSTWYFVLLFRRKYIRNDNHSPDNILPPSTATFEVKAAFQLTGRCFILLGKIISGSIHKGMVVDLHPIGIEKRLILEAIEFALHREDDRAWEDVGLGISGLTEEEKNFLQGGCPFFPHIILE